MYNGHYTAIIAHLRLNDVTAGGFLDFAKAFDKVDLTIEEQKATQQTRNADAMLV